MKSAKASPQYSINRTVPSICPSQNRKCNAELAPVRTDLGKFLFHYRSERLRKLSDPHKHVENQYKSSITQHTWTWRTYLSIQLPCCILGICWTLKCNKGKASGLVGFTIFHHKNCGREDSLIYLQKSLLFIYFPYRDAQNFLEDNYALSRQDMIKCEFSSRRSHFPQEPYSKNNIYLQRCGHISQIFLPEPSHWSRCSDHR